MAAQIHLIQTSLCIWRKPLLNGLRYVVVTSVDRDDLRDGGASHFTACIKAIREKNPTIKIEVLVPDYRGRMEIALDETGKAMPDVFNHNIETVPRLYKQARPGSDYAHSLRLLQAFKKRYPSIPNKIWHHVRVR